MHKRVVRVEDVIIAERILAAFIALLSGPSAASAIRLESGAHSTHFTPFSIFVSCWASPPLAGIT